MQDQRVSSEHAVVHWSGAGWEIKDLGSRNGTFVGGRRAALSESVTLVEGAEIAIGDRDITFILDDASPPVPSARNLRTNELRLATTGLLLLPDEEDPLVTIFERNDGQWMLESQTDGFPVTDLQEITVGDDLWRLELPDFSSATIDTLRIGPTMETIGLRFAVSRDEERVELTVLTASGEIRMAPRTYHAMLLVLARAWEGDARASMTDRGWMDREELCKKLRVEPAKLNVDIFRARSQFSRAGVHGAASLVVRRVDSAQLRLGVHEVEIVKL